MAASSRGIARASLALIFACLSCSCTFQRSILRETNKIIELPQAQAQVWFTFIDNGRIGYIGVKRPGLRSSSSNLRQAVQSLLDGPSKEETKKGIGSEIPRGTVLLGIEETASGIVLDLSRRFAGGGGSGSIEARLEQLKRTVSSIAGKQAVYLNIEGKRLNMTPGEGIEISQPINK